MIKLRINKKIGLVITIFIVFIFIVSFYLYNGYSERKLSRDSLSLNPIFEKDVYVDNFIEDNADHINERIIYQKNNSNYKTEEVLIDESDYILTQQFYSDFISTLHDNFIPIKKEGGMCTINVNPKRKRVVIDDCNNDFIFKRSVSIAIDKFNDNFEGYKKLSHIDNNIEMSFMYKL